MRYQRELTAAVLIPVVLAILIAGETWMWALLVAAASAVALLEFYGLIASAGWVAPRWAGLLILLALLLAAFLGNLRALVALGGAALLVLPTLVMFAAPPEVLLLPSSASSVFATLYVAAGGASMIGLRAIGWKPVLLLLAVVWAGDSAAYYVGRRWGKRKLAPVVSPKKTWAGLFGQIAGGTLFAALAALVLSPVRETPAAAALGAFLSVVAVVGDLLESTFKRSCAVKDSGGILPGHGGLLDRLDSLLYASPVLLLVLTFLPEALSL